MTTNSAWLNLSTAVQLGNLSRVRDLLQEEDDLADLSIWSDGYALLRDAIEDVQVEIVEHLLQHNISVNRKSKKLTDTPLHLAIHMGDIDLINTLLDKGADVTAKGKCKKTPLHVAAEYSKIEVIELLIDKGSDVSAKDQDGWTPLCLAIKRGRLEIVDFFLNHETYDGQLDFFLKEELVGVDTPMHLAAASGNKELVIYLISEGARVNVQGIDLKTPLHIAVQENCESVVEYLLDHGADLNMLCTYCAENNCTALHIAADISNAKIINLLLSKGANIHNLTTTGLTPLHIAARRNNVECVKMLLNNQDFDIDNYLNMPSTDEGYTPLHFASMFGCNDVVEFLLKMKADLSIYSFDKLLPIHVAITKGYEKIVALLLNYGSDPDTLFDNDKTLLLQAVEYGDFKVVEQILKFNPDITNKNNKSSLKIAVQSFKDESKAIVKALLDYGFKIDVNDSDKCELIHISVEKGFTSIVKDFLQAGIDVNQPVSSSLIYQKSTLLHIAIKNHQSEIVQLLLNKNALVDIKDSFGFTSIYYAVESRELDIIKLILEHNNLNSVSKRELLFNAVKKSNIEIIELILQYVDVNITDEYGRTALHVIDLISNTLYETYDDHLSRRKIVNLLISKGGNVDARTQKNDTVLDYAVLYQNPHVLEELLMHNANTNYLNCYGDTPLALAAIKGNSKIIELLIGYNVDPNLPNYKGITPLLYAVENNNEEALQCLLDNGACIDWRYRFDGKTALHVAIDKKNINIVRLLLKYGADVNLTDFSNQTPVSYSIKFHSDTNSTKIIRILKEHVIKLKCANLYVNEINFKFGHVLNKMTDFYHYYCQKEIDKIKKTKVIDNHVFCYNDILTMNTQKLSIYLKNAIIVKNFKNNKIENQYPVYCDLLKKRFNDGLSREKLLVSIDKYLTKIFPGMPYDCIHQIFYYLSNDNLRQLISANTYTSSNN